MRKKFLLLLAATMAACGTAWILSACNKTPEPGSQVFSPGDTIIEEREGEFTYDSSGHLVYEKYTAKNVEIRYLVSESSYVTLTGQKPTELVISGYKGDIKELSVSALEDDIIINDAHIAVVGVADDAFYGCETLESVDLTKTNISLTFSVGSGAFANCVSLKSVTIPENIYTTSVAIGDKAFYNDISLTSVNLGNKLVDLGQNAFYNCTALTTISVPENISVIQEGTFAYCDMLGSISVAAGANLKSIQAHAFVNTAISSLNLGGLTELRYIGDSAFENTKLSSVNLSDSVTFIGNRAFYNCENLTSVNVPFIGNSIAQSATFDSIFGVNGVDNRSLNVTAKTALSIPESSFADLKNVQTLSINSFAKAGAQKIYNSDGVSFERYNLLDEKSKSEEGDLDRVVNINKTVGARAFYRCTALTAIKLPADIEEIATSAFEGCEALNSFTIPAAVQSIGNYAFYDCAALQEIAIPASVTSVGNRAFGGCDNITKLTIGSLGGIVEVFDYELNEYVYRYEQLDVASWFDSHNQLAEIIVSSLYTLPASTFSGLSSLEKVELTFKAVDESIFQDDNFAGDIPGTSQIGNYAFSNCTSLTTVTINDADGILSVIGSRAFNNCKKLPSFTVPETIDSIGTGAFFGCSSMTSITVNAYNKIVSEVAITGDTKIYRSLGSVNKWFDCEDGVPYPIKTVTLKGVNSLAANSFFGWENLVTLNIEFTGTLYSGSGTNIEPHYTEIGGCAFTGCKNLANLNVTGGANVKVIGNDAFRGCEKFTSADLAKFSNVASIGNCAFDGCKAITVVTLPGTLAEIGVKVFANCPGITVLNIGNYAAFNQATVACLFGSDNGYVTDGKDSSVSVQKYVAANGYNVPVSLETITINGVDYLSDLKGSFFKDMSMVKVISLNILPASFVLCSSGDLAPFSGCTSLVKVFLPESVTAIYLADGISADTLPFELGTDNVYEYAAVLSSYGNFWRYGEDGKEIVINNKYEGEIDYTLDLTDGEWKADGEETDVKSAKAVHTVDKPLTEADIPEIAEKEGYVLVGWYDDSSFGGKPVTFPYYSKTDTSLYAKWVKEADLIDISSKGFSESPNKKSGSVTSDGAYNSSTFTVTVRQKSTVTLTVGLSSGYECGVLVVKKNGVTIFTIDNDRRSGNVEYGIYIYKNTITRKTLIVNLAEGETVKIEFTKYVSYGGSGANGYATVKYDVGDRVYATLPSAPVIPKAEIPTVNVSDIVSEKGHTVSSSQFESIMTSFANLSKLDGFSGEMVFPNGGVITEEYDYVNNVLKQVIEYNGGENTYYYVARDYGTKVDVYFKLTDEQIEELKKLRPGPEYEEIFEKMRGKWLTMTQSGTIYPNDTVKNAIKEAVSTDIENYEYDTATGAYWRVIASEGAYKTVVALIVDDSGNAHVYLSLLRYNEVYLTLKFEDLDDVSVTLPSDLDKALKLDGYDPW